LSSYDAVEVVQIMCTSAGPGSAALADSWASSFGLTNVQVWGDTTDYMYTNFTSALGGSYPSTLVIELDTMEIASFRVGAVESAASQVEEILAADHPCAE
jgi:hypothetical protein